MAARRLSQKQLEAAIQEVARLVNVAKKPVIYAGQGLLARPEGPEILAEFAAKASIPVTTTLQGLGGFDELDRKSLHMLGMSLFSRHSFFTRITSKLQVTPLRHWLL